MSFNISQIKEQKLEAYIERRTFRRLAREMRGNMPGWCFLRDDGTHRVDRDRVWIVRFAWHNEWSGNSFDALKTKVLPHVVGTIAVVIFWEGGEAIEGLIVRGGSVIECDVEMTLVQKTVKRTGA